MATLNKSLPITIAAGHSGNYGAAGCGYREEVLTKELVGLIYNKFKALGYNINNVSPKGSYNISNQLIAEYTNANAIGNSQLHICVHFNASNGQGHGTETWIYAFGNKAEPYAHQVTNAIANTLGITNRGVKASGTSLCIPRRVNAPVILIETAFIDNQNDMNKYQNKKDDVAKAIVEALTGIKINNDNNDNKELNRSMYMFSKNWYLYKYPDVANSGYKDDPYVHYVEYGKKEGRLPVPPIPKEYKEADYLELNPDVAAAVAKGTFVSGIDHYMQYGFKDGRKICK